MIRVGRIIKGIGGFYTVALDDGTQVQCKARGLFRKEGITPMVGDLVEALPQDGGEWSLRTILPRKNALIRPPVSNIDQLVLVLAASAPKPDWQLADKLIVQSKLLDIAPVLVLNKLDERDTEVEQDFLSDYGGHFPAFCVSAKSGMGLDALSNALAGQVSCFAGQSAVGKSSLLNALIPELALETGELTKKTDRGRHTTRHAELWPYRGGAVLDTPGFSLFEATAITQEQLNNCYPEFDDAPQRCRFAGCAHITEPDCAVRELLSSGGLSAGRYHRYVELCKQIQQRRLTKYD